jgi:hypothetical protein
MKNKKQVKKVKRDADVLGMLPNLIGGFIVILIGISLMGTISQQLDNALNCNITSEYVNITEQPKGSTGSFGGGGSDYHFGGYDGQVVHKSFLSQYSVIDTNKSMIGCINMTSYGANILSLVPLFFGLGIILAAIGMGYGALKQGGMV